MADTNQFRTHIKEPRWQQLASIAVMVILLLFASGKVFFLPNDSKEDIVLMPASTTAISVSDTWNEGEVSERYSARVDRVDVIFEQIDYTSYRLQTNDLVRTGTLNTERGYKDDEDATVYVLNWDKPAGQQIRYVRLTVEPNHLYYLDSENNIIKGSQLTKQ